MRKQSLALTAGVAMAIAGLAPTVASATGVCYAFTLPAGVQTFDNYSPLVVRYIPVNVGSINTDTEARVLGHLKQQAYSLVGKATVLFGDHCDESAGPACTTNEHQFRLMTTVDGTIITGKVLTGTKPADPPGAHMGMDVQFLRTLYGNNTQSITGNDFAIGPLTMECTSEQSTPTPNYWSCNVKAEIDTGYAPFFWQFIDLNLPIVLEKLPANTAAACSVFRDGDLFVYPEA